MPDRPPSHSLTTAPQADAELRSFWIGGYEGADHVNGRGVPLQMSAANGHLAQVDADYARLAEFGIACVRESVGWRSSERGGQFDFRHLDGRMDAAFRHGIQIVWTLWHYGVPDGVDVFALDLRDRFARFAAAFARYLQTQPRHGELIVNPINEISFLGWGVCETGLFHPHRGDRAADGYALKRNLVRAALGACHAIRAVEPQARFLHVDPVIHIASTNDDYATMVEAARHREHQFQAWDLLTGRVDPELGGSPDDVDYIGINYYHANQWEYGSNRRLHWHLRDPRRQSLSSLLGEVHRRYGRPLLIAETSHVGEGRAAWIRDVGDEVALARAAGVPVDGICLYPIVDRPDWEEPSRWHRSGLWDVEDRHAQLPRVLDAAYARALVAAQHVVADHRAEPDCTRSTCPNSGAVAMHTLIVFSHLRWNFVFQRPQHLLQELAGNYRVLFVEEPVFEAGVLASELTTPAPGITVLRPHTSVADAPGFHDSQMEPVRQLLAEQMATAGIDDYSVWLYTPMALPLLNGLHPRTVIYDCMDELSAFRNAPAQLLSREATLFKLANVVLTGGPSLYEAKRDRHANVHCLPSSVDVAHFAAAATLAPHPALDGLPTPRLGYIGVIDERIDLNLIAALAKARPDWQICMVGPVVKVDPASLPQAPNLHYFPQQAYEQLPHFLAGWQVCLMPFALNEATRYISPTKSLEYMAAGLPVVSTAVKDVLTLYRDGVAVADDADGFIAACAAALAESAGQITQRIAVQQALTAATSWKASAATIAIEIERAREAGLSLDALMFFESRRVVDLAASRPHTTAECLILGAGPTGLSAAYHYGENSVLVERNATVGGWCRSIDDGGFQFDYAGHIMFSNDAYVQSLYDLLLGDNQHWQNREAWIYSKRVHTRYPFQGALYGLPPDVLKECLVGAIEARYSSLASVNEAPATDAALDDCCADGAVCIVDASGDVKDAGALPQRESGTVAQLPQASESFESFIYRVWGSGVARHFAIPYNRKLWTVPLTEMETSWLGGRVPMPNLEDMIDGALQPVAKPMGPNARFGYPLRGGFQALMDAFVPHLRGELMLETSVIAVSPRERRVTLADGRQLHYQTLVSTLPLPELIRCIGAEAPEEIHRAAQGLRHVSVRCVNLGIGRERITDKHWIYYPEETVFHRIFVQGNASPHCNPAGGFGLTCEISYSPTKPLPCDGEELIQRCIRECIEVGIINADDPLLVANQADMPYAYVLYDHARARNVRLIRDWLEARDILLSGRYSEWEYYNSDHAFLAGRNVAEQVRVRGEQKAESTL